ncbi:hypothetical protein FRC02_001112 [Tulasnella sp. 418]|nr:hypothetical protein FRC02_001112 [Tulasnella sp. 418]
MARCAGEVMGRRPRASSIAGSEAEEDDEEIYDWSNEEDLVDQEAKYQKNMGKIPKKQGFSTGNPSPDSSSSSFSTLLSQPNGSIITSAALVAVPILLRIIRLNKDNEHSQ